MKKILTPVAILVSTFAVTAAHAEAKVDYFAGVDAGVNFGAKQSKKTDRYTLNQKTKAAPVYGIHGGVTIDDHHRVTLGYNHSEQKLKEAVNKKHYDSISAAKNGVDTLKLQYDYVYNLTNNINITGGTHLGYQWYGKTKDTGKLSDKDRPKYNKHLDGMIYGLQTGIEYNLDQWTIGTELGYSWKDQNNYYGDKTKTKNSGEGTFLTSVSYHF